MRSQLIPRPAPPAVHSSDWGWVKPRRENFFCFFFLTLSLLLSFFSRWSFIWRRVSNLSRRMLISTQTRTKDNKHHASLLIVVRFLDTYHFEVGCSWRSTDCNCTIIWSCSNIQLCNECKIIHMVYSSGLPWVSARVGVALDIYAGSHPRSWPNRGNVTLC